MANEGGAGGTNKGVTLHFQQKPAPLDWQRNLFSGLAQIIVQLSLETGEIKLTAKADGLTPSMLKLTPQSAPRRPAVAPRD